MNIAWSVAALPLGLCLGSYATTAAMRAARGQDHIRGRSRCDGCGQVLSFAMTVPLASFLRQGGGCATCGGRIDPMHPAGELAGGLILWTCVAALPAERGWAACALGLLLLGASVFDVKTQRLPDATTALSAALCFYLGASHGWQRCVVGLVAAMAAAITLQCLRCGFAKLHSDPGLGLGDLKLAAAAALWLGAMTPWMLVGASALGLASFAIVKPQSKRLAFGPSIAASTICFGLASEALPWAT